jgi:hypothetical protein
MACQWPQTLPVHFVVKYCNNAIVSFIYIYIYIYIRISKMYICFPDTHSLSTFIQETVRPLRMQTRNSDKKCILVFFHSHT